MKVDVDGIGPRLLKYRKSIGLTQQQMEEKSGIGRSYIAHVEKGTIPSGDFIIKLLNTFNISADWLLTGKGQMFLPEEEHIFNRLKDGHIQLLENLTSLEEKRQRKVIKAILDLLNVE